MPEVIFLNMPHDFEIGAFLRLAYQGKALLVSCEPHMRCHGVADHTQWLILQMAVRRTPEAGAARFCFSMPNARRFFGPSDSGCVECSWWTAYQEQDSALCNIPTSKHMFQIPSPRPAISPARPVDDARDRVPLCSTTRECVTAFHGLGYRLRLLLHNSWAR